MKADKEKKEVKKSRNDEEKEKKSLWNEKKVDDEERDVTSTNVQKQKEIRKEKKGTDDEEDDSKPERGPFKEMMLHVITSVVQRQRELKELQQRVYLHGFSDAKQHVSKVGGHAVVAYSMMDALLQLKKKGYSDLDDALDASFENEELWVDSDTEETRSSTARTIIANIEEGMMMDTRFVVWNII